jgi:signal transduction histidine kinase
LGSQARQRSDRWTVALQVGQFALAGLIALVLVGVGTAIASRRVSEREAIDDARATTAVKAQSTVQPVVTDEILTGDPAAVAALDAVVQRDVLDSSLVRLKIWTPDGTIVYSDARRLVGASYELGPDERASIDSGRIEAEVSDLSKPENRFERRWSKLLEVYMPIRTPSGAPLLFEAYFRYTAVEDAASRLWESFAPISLGSLALLSLVELPLAWSLASRLRQRMREREGLLQRALDASELERRQIASDLHDGVVQDLAGVAYTLDGAARRGDDTSSTGSVYADSAEAVRASIRALRSLLVEIYPPNLEEEGLESALSDLLARTDGHLTAELDLSALREPLSSPTAGLLYRAAQEALRNVLSHAQAHTVRVRVSIAGDAAILEVEDDGRGFESDAATSQVEEGHVGLKAIAGLVADAGGTLLVRSAPGEGTTFRVEVPLR